MRLERRMTCLGQAAATAASAASLLRPYALTGAAAMSSVDMGCVPSYTWSVDRCTSSGSLQVALRAVTRDSNSFVGTLTAHAAS